MIADKVKKNIEEKKLIDKGDMVVLGLSGGPDSVCLFSILQGLRDEIGFEMSCVHVNHMLRGKDAEADLDYCCKLCEKNDIRFFPFVVNVREEAEKCKVSFEEKGREIRYEKFLSVADEYKDSGKRVKIAVAHHFDDQAETIIMRIMRGTGTDGLAGMRFMREENGIPIVRPLLNIKKEDINDYCSKVGLMPRIDCTNEQSDYVRNRIRLELLPYMREYFNEKVDESICRLGDLAALDREYFDVLTEDVLSESEVIKDKVKTLWRFDRKKIRNLHEAVFGRLVLKIFSKGSFADGLSYERIHACLMLVQSGANGKTVEMPCRFYMYVSASNVDFYILNDSFENITAVGTGNFDEYEIKTDICKKKQYAEEKQEDGRRHKRENIKAEFVYKLKVGDIFETMFDLPAGRVNMRVIELNGDMEISDSDIEKSSSFSGNGNTVTGEKKGYETIWKGKIDYDKLCEATNSPELRTRRAGDYIVPLGMKGKKKLKDFFIDNKISPIERNSVPLLCAGNEVFVLIGERISDNVKIDEKSRRVLLLEYLK